MTLGELIESLKRRAAESEQGLQSEVRLNLHVLEHNGSGYYIEKEIDDVCNVWSMDEDYALIETVLSADELDELQRLKSDKLND